MKKSFDKHLNIFWNYTGGPGLEDNITRSFILTLSSLKKDQQLQVINNLINKNHFINSDNLEINFDLQNPYLKKEEIAKAPFRYLVGLNPSGKAWGNKLYDVLENFGSHNFEEKNLKDNCFKKYLSNKFPDKKEILEEKDQFGVENSETLKHIILERLKKGNSRPDGWIFVYENKILKLVVAIETKLYDFDPYQLSNHCEKSLYLKENETQILHKFEDIFNLLKKISKNKKNLILNDFLNYVERLKYYINSDTFSKEDFDYAFDNDDLLLINRKLDKLFRKYFKSEKYNFLVKKYKLNPEDLKRRRITLKSIGDNGIGNIYFDSCFNDNFSSDSKYSFFIGTEIGIARKHYNEKFNNQIKNDNFITFLENLYPNKDNSICTHIFEVFFRINQVGFSDYIHLKDFNNIKDCLEYKNNFPYQNNLTKIDCINILEKEYKTLKVENIKSHIESLRKRGKNYPNLAKNYNILSYVRFIDFIKTDALLKVGSSEEFNELFHQILVKHLDGLNKINENLKYS